MQVNAQENFRQNLRAAMEARGISQRALASSLGMSYTYLNRVLCVGKAEEKEKDSVPKPTLEICEKLAGGVGFALVDLLQTPKKFHDSLLRLVA